MPVEDRSRFTSAFGKRDIDNGPRDHWGVDFGGPTPGESVFAKAAADGVMEWIKTIPLRSGPAIGIRHPDGSLTAYLHTRRHKVKPGQQVKRGEVIAETWHTGIPLSNGIHLHFEWWDDYRDHRSVFNPLSRLAQYGWVIKDGRLYDEWDGRATATPSSSTDKPSAIIPAAPAPQEGELTVSDVSKIMHELAQIRAQISGGHVQQLGKHDEEAARDAGDSLADTLAEVRSTVNELRAIVGTTSRTSAWVIDPETGQQVEVYLSGVLQRIDGKLSALVESAENAGTVEPDRVRTLAPAVNTVKEA
ncbi:M23 family metallopeptidase [Citricoccus sp. K5]|uniref:M23 family metallopeptidase n=1 Tax=Citricoccus sp. K5 TaxID=2653135 RepID=UPI0012F2DBA0|nr:M23 family metallopeptidase [Citricoccus sp. K5]VXA92138.1 hypothetical protein CITRIK5_100007 [Citricoccus sp. K5]VXA94077.1 hypothetical protein CITRIK5_100073 [Citricoccus sp. K5]